MQRSIKGETWMLKDVNIQRIRACLLTKEYMTKKEVATLTELSFQTVNRIIDEMVEDTEVHERGYEDSTGGRRAKAYAINPHYAYTLGMYIIQDTLHYSIYNVLGEKVEEGICHKEKQSYVETIDEAIGSCIAKYSAIKSISIGVPGSVSKGTIKYIDTYTELQNYPLKTYLSQKWRRQVAVENDMKAVVLGYAVSGGRNEENVVALYLGHNGPGCGMLVNGNVVRGATEFAGEVGFIPMYNEYNLQQLALKDFQGADRIDYFARLLTGVTAFINPSTIVLYEDDKIPSVNELKEACAKYLPVNEVPNMISSKEFKKHYMMGLYSLGQQLIYKPVIIQA